MTVSPTDLPRRWKRTITLDAASEAGRLLQLLDEMQHIAWAHARELKVAYDELLAMNRMWVLTRLYLQRRAPLPPGSELDLLTWPVGSDKRTAHREFRLSDEGGAVLANATSSWAILERDTRVSVPMDEMLDGHLPPDLDPPTLQYPGRVIPKLKDAGGDAEIAVTADDIDVNGHVNNIRYLAWAMEALPGLPADGEAPAAIDLMFRAEAFEGDRLAVRWAQTDNGKGLDATDGTVFTHLIERDGHEITRLQTKW